MVANVAENSVLFCGYGMCQNLVTLLQGKDSNRTTTLDKAVAGSFAAFFASFTLCPTELIKCKLQALRERSQPGNNQVSVGAVQLTKQILKQEGIPGLYRGLSSTIFREMPGYFFFFGGYEYCKVVLTKRRPDEAGLLQTVISGGFGGVCLWTTIFPFDVAKSRIQVDSLRDSMRVVLVRVMKEEGIRGLYKGLTPTLLRTFPSTGALFVAYEYSKEWMTRGATRFAK